MERRHLEDQGHRSVQVRSRRRKPPAAAAAARLRGSGDQPEKPPTRALGRISLFVSFPITFVFVQQNPEVMGFVVENVRRAETGPVVWSGAVRSCARPAARPSQREYVYYPPESTETEADKDKIKRTIQARPPSSVAHARAALACRGIAVAHAPCLATAAPEEVSVPGHATGHPDKVPETGGRHALGGGGTARCALSAPEHVRDD